MRHSVYELLAKISGWLLVVYVGLKSVDTIVWLNETAPRTGVTLRRTYAFDAYDPDAPLDGAGAAGVAEDEGDDEL